MSSQLIETSIDEIWSKGQLIESLSHNFHMLFVFKNEEWVYPTREFSHLKAGGGQCSKHGSTQWQEKLVSLISCVSSWTSDKNHVLWDFLLCEKNNPLFVYTIWGWIFFCHLQTIYFLINVSTTACWRADFLERV